MTTRRALGPKHEVLRSGKTGPASSSEEAERAMLLGALADNRGNLTRAAQAVGYEREMFESALRRFGISEVM